MRYSSKPVLLADIIAEHDRLAVLLDDLSPKQQREPGVWGDGWSAADLVAHLAEWQDMFLHWYEAGRAGTAVALPAPGFKWNETPRLNRMIWEKHRRRSPQAVRNEFEQGYARIRRLVTLATPQDLFAPGRFQWTGRNALSTYLGANSASHYRFARKVIERWRRQAKRPRPSA
jgi:hypothetical protein